MSNICDFDRILKTECNLQHFTRNCRIKNLDDFERDETDAYLRRVGLLNVKEKGMTICYIMIRCLVVFLRGGKVNVWSIDETSSLFENSEFDSYNKNDMKDKASDLVRLHKAVREKLKTASYSKQIQILTLVPDELS